MTGKKTMLPKLMQDKLITGSCVRCIILILIEVTKTYGPMLNVNGTIK